jgi:hypothetical protein
MTALSVTIVCTTLRPVIGSVALAEATHQYRGAVGNERNGSVGVGDELVHAAT